ncbi:uncharacterized protein TNCV_2801911 [Trichonephila clavipes]|nr:uncharacterized protein TNCV_2801911 [Trichonephila clavipes]
MVILKEDNLPLCNWPLGRILEVYQVLFLFNINMVSEESDIDAYINQKWFNLNADLEKSVVEKWWNTLKSSYTRPHRKYHTFFHVKRMFTHMDSLINEIQNKDAVSYAIFFHDIAYDPRSQENEDRSVEIFNEFCTESELSKNEELVAKVKELILALKAHCTDEHKKEGLFGKDDLHYFLDFDMSVLGSDPAEYKKYTQQIREEYNFMPKSKYNSVRSKHKNLHKPLVCSYVLGIKRDKTGKMSFLSLMAVTLLECTLLVKLFYESKGNAAAALQEFRRLKNLRKGPLLPQALKRMIARFEKTGHLGVQPAR